MQLLLYAATTLSTGPTTVLTRERELCKCRRIVSSSTEDRHGNLPLFRRSISRTLLLLSSLFSFLPCRLWRYLGMHFFFCLLFQHSVRFEEDIFPLYDYAWFHCKRHEGRIVGGLLCVVCFFFYFRGNWNIRRHSVFVEGHWYQGRDLKKNKNECSLEWTSVRVFIGV